MMQSVSRPLVAVTALVSAGAGSATTDVVLPADDPKGRALFARQVELLEQEAAAREAAAERRQDFLASNPDNFPTAGGQETAPRFEVN